MTNKTNDQPEMVLSECMTILARQARSLVAEQMNPTLAQATTNTLGKWLTGIKTKLVYHQLRGEIPEIAEIDELPARIIKDEDKAKLTQN